jgi:hypothetical protein
MVIQYFIGAGLIAINVVFQALAFDAIIKRTQWLENMAFRRMRSLWKALTVAIVVLCVSCTLIVEIWTWALFYYFFDVIVDLESALYFSTVTFTTVGYGDVVLDKGWRILSSVEALNGFLLFGWSAAFIFEIVSILYIKEGRAIEHRNS